VTDTGLARPRRTLRGRLKAYAARKVRYWTFGHDVIFWGDERQNVHLLGPAWPTFKIVEGTVGESAPVTIGRYTALHATVSVLTGSEHHLDWVGILHAYVQDGSWVKTDDDVIGDRGPVIVGSDCWVGYEALIMSGVTIGDGAVIAARALVRRDVEPYAIVGGNPAKVIGYRFDEPTREALLRIRWWDWSDEKVAAHTHQISSPEVQAFVASHDPELGPLTCPLCAAR
jgi:acetyltransferase-like isoleucine patch superfamily enzyme